MANEIVQVPDDGDVTVRAMVANVLNATWTEGLNRAAAYDLKVDEGIDSFLDLTNISTLVAVNADDPTPVDSGALAVTATPMSLPTDVSATNATASSVSAGTAVASSAVGYSANLVSAVNAMMEAVGAAAAAASPGASVPELAATIVATEPNVYIPYIASDDELWIEWWDKTLELIELLVAEGARFTATYAPYEADQYTAVSEYLLASLANTGVGMPASVVAQIIGDDTQRLMVDTIRAEDTIFAQFASRGFPLPPGVLVSAYNQIEQTLANNLAESSRKISMMSVELQKFNIEKLIDLRKVFLAALPDYIKAIATGPEVAAKVLGTNYDAQQKLINAGAAWFNARINSAEAINKVAMANASLATDVSKTNAAMVTDTSKANASLSTEVSKTNASLSSEAAKTNASLATEVSKTNASLGTDVSKANASLSVEVEKTNASLSTDVSKANMGAALDASKTTASLATEISKANAGLQLDAGKANLGKEVDVGKTNATLLLDAAKATSSIAADIEKLNSTLVTDISKLNVVEQNRIAVENLNTEKFMVEKNLVALIEQAKVMSTMGTALLNNIHAALGIAANRDTRVGYNYSNETTGQPAGFSDVG